MINLSYPKGKTYLGKYARPHKGFLSYAQHFAF